MEALFSFIAVYADKIYTILCGVAGAIFRKPKDKGEAIVRIVVIVLGFLIIIACFLVWSGGDGGEVTPSLTKALEKTAYVAIEASSIYNGDLVTHYEGNLIDNDLKTNWTEGVHGKGEGEYIDFTFHTKQPLAGFRISAGNHASDAYYDKNARPGKITVTFDDASTKEYTLLDKKETQVIYFDKVVNTESVRLIIKSVYPGRAYEDTVISEISFLVQES